MFYNLVSWFWMIQALVALVLFSSSGGETNFIVVVYGALIMATVTRRND